MANSNKYSYGRYLILLQPFKKNFFDWSGSQNIDSIQTEYYVSFFKRVTELCYDDKHFRYLVIKWMETGGLDIIENIFLSLSIEYGEKLNSVKTLKMILNFNKFTR
jgi:hypothetical protein